MESFIQWASNLKGDERGEAQLFLEHLFQAFGHANLQEAGATLEYRVKSVKIGTRFADLVWPGRCLIEMKKRGAPLGRHYLQAFEYWIHLVPNRPPWVVLCNFDEFWIYNFNRQVDEPLDKIKLADLDRQAGALSFLKPVPETPIFGSNRIQVTLEAADWVAGVFNSMIGRGVPREQAQRFILQCVVAKFSEDLDLLPRNFFTRILDECLNAPSPGDHAFDAIGGLFRQMNSPQRAAGGRYRAVDYFNGGLFAVVDPVAPTDVELSRLHEAALQDWSQVNPAIFGTIFQHSMGAAERHAFGAHYTSEADILKVVNPTIVRPWRDRLDAADTLKDLRALRVALTRYKVLDPACGSGNFLYIAYRELKRIELDLFLKMRKKFTYQKVQHLDAGSLSVKQFYGFDTLDFAVELAKVTLLIGKELALREAGATLTAELGTSDYGLELDPALPLDNLDENIRRADALFTDWPEVDAIIGNPPFQSKNKMRREFGDDYMDNLRAAYPAIPGRADYCVYFFRKAHDSLAPGDRAGLVGTNTIRENFSRVGGLDHIVDTGGTIVDAVSSQDWSGDAAVHVSIVNWIKGPSDAPKQLSTQNDDGSWSMVELDSINSSLADRIDVSKAFKLKQNMAMGVCQGQTHGHDGFVLNWTQASEIDSLDASSAGTVHFYLIGETMIGRPGGRPDRFVIDLNHCGDVLSAQRHKNAFAHLAEHVMPDILRKAKEEREQTGKDTGPRQTHAKRWWKHWRGRDELMSKLSTLKRYIVCSRVTKRQIFEFVVSGVHPNDSLVVFPFDDDYSFGVLQSAPHWVWFKAKCSTFEERPRYTSESVFDTFPWPQNPTAKQKEQVAKAARDLRALRLKIMKENGWSLRDLYRASEKPGENPLKKAQKRLDEAVAAAYGMAKKENVLRFLLKLNREIAAEENKKGL